MKNSHLFQFSFSILLLLLFVVPLQGQLWTSTGDDIHNTNKGNVGIGTELTTPQNRLHVHVKGFDDGLRISGSMGKTNNVRLWLENKNGGGHTYSLFSTGGDAEVGKGKFGIRDETEGKMRLFIDETGRVGLNTISPAARFHVMGGTEKGGMLISPDTRTGGDASLKLAENSSGDDAMVIKYDGAHDRLSIHGFTSGAESAPLLIIKKGSGAVGIGTDVLPKDAKLAVCGKILCTEVEVALKKDWEYPDYVFEPRYNLLSLPQLEEKIKSLGHLPGMLSATEIEAEGMNLGALHIKLLEKVEELTLYLIAQDKEITKLKKQINTQTK